MKTGVIPTPVKVESVFDDPRALRGLIEHCGPYQTMASYLPPSAGLGSRPEAPVPWFRQMWALNGRPLVEGVEAILHNHLLIEAASTLFDTPNVIPKNVFVNVNAPMPAGVVHVDIPSFRGATRDRYPMGLLQAMGASGLFEPWRIVEVGAVSWFYDGPGGAYDYWPDGLDGPMRSERPPFVNEALVADNDRMYHRIGWIGDPAPDIPVISAEAVICHFVTGGWVVMDQGEKRARYADEQIRRSIVWKAQVLPDAETRDQTVELTPGRVAEIFAADLHSRGISTPVPSAPLSDETWMNLVHETYYAAINLP